MKALNIFFFLFLILCINQEHLVICTTFNTEAKVAIVIDLGSQYVISDIGITVVDVMLPHYSLDLDVFGDDCEPGLHLWLWIYLEDA